MKKENKTSYEKDFMILMDLVNEWDPANLISYGAPKNEYEYLVSKILPKLYEGISSERLEEFLINQVKDRFGYSYFKSDKALKKFCRKVNSWCKD